MGSESHTEITTKEGQFPHANAIAGMTSTRDIRRIHQRNQSRVMLKSVSTIEFPEVAVNVEVHARKVPDLLPLVVSSHKPNNGFAVFWEQGGLFLRAEA